MSIKFNPKNKIFHLQASDTSYIIQIYKSGHLAHLYWGQKVKSSDLSYVLQIGALPWETKVDINDPTYSLDNLPQEYPAYGTTDLRQPAYQVQLENGTTITELLYSTHRIFKGKPKLEGLPATYVESEDEAETLEIEMYDSIIDLKVILSYTIFEKLNVITRSVRFVNEGAKNLKLLRTLSMSVDFADSDFDLLHLSGAWARERHIEKRRLTRGIQSIGSSRGCSSHQHNPFIALMKNNVDEHNGEVYGFSLVYSGNHLAQVEVDHYDTTRVTMGINPFDFSWLLESSESFQSPEVVMVYSTCGLNGMSQTYHELYRTRLCRGKFRDMERPILINNWEATYFDFNSDKLFDIAKAGKELGMELFVLDDGWFGKRNIDDCSLGDWYENKEKMPEGLKGLSDKINAIDMEFGIWFEPEMVSPDSDLYRAHPDWCIHVPDRNRSQERSQLILDFSRSEVCESIKDMLSNILANAPITYVKWDMNRNMSEVGSLALPPERQKEVSHRYILGLYWLMEELTNEFPNVLFEGCAGGGGRFDPGILHYMPQIWASDDSDAIERLYVQYGTSIVYPPSSICAHVSAVPNHVVHRNTSLETRGNVAMSGVLGYELDLTKTPDIDKEIMGMHLTKVASVLR